MRIESQQMELNNHNVKQKKQKGIDIFELMFSRNLNLENGEEKQSNLNIDEKFVQVSLKKLINLEEKIKSPEVKKELTEFINKLLNQENISNLKDVNKSLHIEQLKQNLLKNNGDNKLEIPESKITNLFSILEKISNLKNELKITDIDVQNIVKEVKKDGKKEPGLIINDIRLVNDGENQDKFSPVVDIQNLRKTDKKTNKIDDPFEELKKQRMEILNTEGKAMAQINPENSNWKVTNVKSDQMKISDWIDSFKQEIDRLTEFKIESNQKVSLMLKEQGEQLRIVVEKRDSYIFVSADVTDNMRDKLNSILAEVQTEMKEKGIEVKLELKEDSENRKENSREDSGEENNKNRQQGGANNGRQFNQSND